MTGRSSATTTRTRAITASTSPTLPTSQAGQDSRTGHRSPPMDSRLTTTVDLAPLLLFGWQLVAPIAELPAVSVLLLIVAAATLVRLATRDIHPRSRRVLILGSGPMASKLIEALDGHSGRYTVAGIVDDERPAADTPAAARWLGDCQHLGDIVTRVQPASIVVAASE